MRNRAKIGALATVVLLGFVAWVMADEKAALPTPQDMEKMSGKELYKFSCKPCHGASSPAGEYTPMTLIQEQWEGFFDEKYIKTHAALTDSTQAVPPGDWITPELRERLRLITPKVLEKIRKFAIDGAADSEHPMTCG